MPTAAPGATTRRPFDEPAVLCDNRSVPHPRSVVLATVFAVFALAAAGCEKVNDVPRMQDEALAVAKAYQIRFDELTRRADAIRLDKLTAPEPRWAFGQARTTLDRVRNELQQAPLTVQDKAKTGNPDELLKLIDTMRQRFEGNVVDTASKLSAVESWLALSERPGGLPPAPSPAEPGTGGPPPGDPAAAPDR